MPAKKESQKPIAPPPIQRPIVLEGHINCIRNGTAYLTLVDENRLGSFAECSLDVLKVDGITNTFEIIIQRGVGMTLRVHKKERLLGFGEWEHIRETLEVALSNSKWMN